MHSQAEPHNDGRGCGVFLHITSLPGTYGCGDLGAEAREFASRLALAGQRYWQLLPLNPTTLAAGDSPYFSNSAQAANPLLISLEDLAEDGLLLPDEIKAAPRVPSGRADFDHARSVKLPLLQCAAQRLESAGAEQEFEDFCEANAHWLHDHALFTALRDRDPRCWIEWPQPLHRRDPAALVEAAEACARPVEIEKRIQFLFHRQWQRLREHCHALGVQLFGDLPIYVNYDSADVWANPAVFLLDEALRPVAESGVPPDYFSATGQLWRNPVYNWRYLQDTDFDWWVKRISTQLARFDLLRIDHFRGLAQYWEVPAGAETAMGGAWKDVPSYSLFDTLRSSIQPLPVVAEDLGTITPDVIELRDRYEFPGMIVLQFAFNDDHHDNPYVPDNHLVNAVAYLGTHDNNTVRGWLGAELDDTGRGRLSRYMGDAVNGDMETQVRAAIDLLLSSRANTAIVCAQDLLALPATARMNTPGVESGNWRWQLTPEQFDSLPLAWLGERCAAAHRKA